MTSLDGVTPHNLEAERAVLGAILVNGEMFLDVAGLLEPADFFRDAHVRIFEVMRELAGTGRTIDPITIKDRLQQKGDLQCCGGPAYFFGLADGVPRSTNIGAYASIVRERAERRRLLHAVRRTLAESEDASLPTAAVIDNAERAIFAVAQHRTGADFVAADALVAEGIPRIERLLETKKGVTGIGTGFADFDDMTRGLQPGTLTIVAARPSMGKSAFALNVAHHVAVTGRSVGLFSLEMSRTEVFMRLTAAAGRLDGHRLQSGYVNETDYARMTEAFCAIGASGLSVDDSAALGMLEARGKARRLKARRGLDLLILDYLQLMQVPKAENRNLAMADVSRSLKLLARELDVPVVALSQLSRETERRGGERRPMLSDLRDSGALEQDADLVVFIHRPEVYQQAPDNAGLAEIIIAKQRNGPIGTVKLRWCKESTRFDNLEMVRG